MFCLPLYLILSDVEDTFQVLLTSDDSTVVMSLAVHVYWLLISTFLNGPWLTLN